jgi:glucosamine-6-phosphate deaminase
LQSYRRFMREYLFDHIDIDRARVHVPDGTIALERSARTAPVRGVDRGAPAGIDIQILGIGRTGHIGFNEPGSASESRTRLITLDRVTRMDAASDFFGEWNVPRKAITMGVGTILGPAGVHAGVRRAQGADRQRAVEGEITASVAASFLQQHPDARIVLDPAAAAELTRFKTPWLLGPLEDVGLEWDAGRTKQGGDLAGAGGRQADPQADGRGLQRARAAGLLMGVRTAGVRDQHRGVQGPAANTITGWPGGKPGRPRFVSGRGVDEANGPDAFPKRVVVFSPHPDDDVISMGGHVHPPVRPGARGACCVSDQRQHRGVGRGRERHADFVDRVLRGVQYRRRGRAGEHDRARALRSSSGASRRARWTARRCRRSRR